MCNLRGFYGVIRKLLFFIAFILILDSLVLLFTGFNTSKLFAALFGIIIIVMLLIDKAIIISESRRSYIVLRSLVALFAVSFLIIQLLVVFAVSKKAGYIDALIVLGAGLQGDQVTSVLQDRLETAYQYYLGHPQTLLVLSGGQGADETASEAFVMRNYLVKRGVPFSYLKIEDRSTDTYSNFANSKVLLDNWYGSRQYLTGFVTNAFHVYRAGLIAKKVGLDSKGISAPMEWYLVPNNYIREYFAIIQFYVFGN